MHSKFTSIVLQDALGSNVEVAIDATRHFMKSYLKLSSPLISAIVVFVAITGYESLMKLPIYCYSILSLYNWSIIEIV